MLQMLNKDIIDRFYKDVEGLGLKFPVAAIAKATGINKGTVSEYLSKKKEPSKRFLDLFYERFGKSLKNVPRELANGVEIKPKDRVMALNAIIQVLIQEVAALKAEATGEHVEVVRKRIQKAAEDILTMGGSDF